MINTLRSELLIENYDLLTLFCYKTKISILSISKHFIFKISYVGYLQK